MAIHLIKFIHLVAVLGCFAAIIFTINNAVKGLLNKQKLRQLILILIFLGLIAFITGLLLVHPKGFTFHTPWIQTANYLMSIFVLAILGLLTVHNKNINPKLIIALYASFAILLLLLVHDAVTKSTFLV